MITLAPNIGAVLAQSALAKRETEMIVGHVLGLGRASVMAHYDRVLDQMQQELIEAMIARRMAGEPMAYILGVREFYGLEFKVSPDVLIPRPETELLVDQALTRLSKDVTSSENSLKRLLDLGTGSGAIAISIAVSIRQHPHKPTIVAADVSMRALDVAQKNARRHRVDIEFVESDWFSEMPNERFDLILSNPPYIAAGDRHLSQGDLRFEPVQALTDRMVGERGLACIRHIVSAAPGHLNSGGWLLFEHGYDQAEACQQLLALHGFTDLVAIPDLAGITRVSGGQFR